MKVLIILDNPQRDVYGVSSLSKEFLNIGYNVYVTGLLTASIDFLVVKPNIVIHTYLRKNNLKFLSMIKKCGCLNFVIESEGIVGNSVEDYFKFVSQCAHFEIIDGYFTWGQKQRNFLIEKYPFFAKKIHCYGNPRFDEFRSFDGCISAHNNILINTNFPIVDPKFSDANKTEIKRNVDVGHDKIFMEGVFKSSEILRNRLCILVSDLSNFFPNLCFTLRPHPFEKSEYYDAFFAQHENVKINTDGTSIEALAKTSILIQLNCTTSMEAYLLGIPVLMPDYINFDNLRYLASEKFSKKIFNYSDMQKEISLILNSSKSKKQLHKSNEYLFIGDKTSSYYIVKCISDMRQDFSIKYFKYIFYFLLRFIRYRTSYKFRRLVELKNYKSLVSMKGFVRIKYTFSSDFLFSVK